MPRQIKVPGYVSQNAKQGLKYHEEGKSGDGLKPQTVREARDMASGSISEDKVRRMAPWLRRHAGDLDAPQNRNRRDPGYPGAGLVAWLLWGGDEDGSMRAAEWAEGEIKRLDEEKEGRSASGMELTPEELNASLKAENESQKAALAQAEANLSTLAEKAKADEANALALAEKISGLEAKVASLEAEKIEALTKITNLEAQAMSVETQAAKIASSCGVNPVAVSPAASAPSMTRMEAVAELSKIQDPAEKQKFFAKHQKILLGL